MKGVMEFSSDLVGRNCTYQITVPDNSDVRSRWVIEQRDVGNSRINWSHEQHAHNVLLGVRILCANTLALA